MDAFLKVSLHFISCTEENSKPWQAKIMAGCEHEAWSIGALERVHLLVCNEKSTKGRHIAGVVGTM